MEDLNLVIFVLRFGCDLDLDETEILKTVIKKWKISQVSVLILTHCEHFSEEEREKMIEQFKKDHPSVAELMGKGILAVGFPDNSHIQPGSQLSQSVKDDTKKLRELIYSCDERVNISETDEYAQRLPELEGISQHHSTMAEQGVQDPPCEHAQTENRLCSIL